MNDNLAVSPKRTGRQTLMYGFFKEFYCRLFSERLKLVFSPFTHDVRDPSMQKVVRG